MALSIFREAPKSDGTPGPVSLRRVLAAFFAVAAVAVVIVALVMGADWKAVAVAVGVPIVAVLVLLFFTTWSDVATVVALIRRKQE